MLSTTPQAERLDEVYIVWRAAVGASRGSSGSGRRSRGSSGRRQCRDTSLETRV